MQLYPMTTVLQMFCLQRVLSKKQKGDHMQLYAGIHISDGKCVNPNKAHYLKNHLITSDPVKLALHWQEMGATYLHVVDLDATTMGYPVNGPIVRDIANAVHIPIQYGGGIRTIKDIDAFLTMGVSRIIIGTQAILNPHFLKEALQIFGKERIVVGIDADNGMVAIEGRARISNFNSITLAQNVEKIGVDTIIYTDVLCSINMNGPDIENTKEMINRTHLNIIYSGGITSLQDLDNLKKCGADGAMIGTSLYTNKIRLDEAITLCKRGGKGE